MGIRKDAQGFLALSPPSHLIKALTLLLREPSPFSVDVPLDLSAGFLCVLGFSLDRLFLVSPREEGLSKRAGATRGRART